MSEYKTKDLTKDVDYKTFFCDGIFLQTKQGISRLIFYEELNPNESADNFDLDKKSIRLKFEVRLSRNVLKLLADHFYKSKNLADFGLDVS